MIFEKPSLRTRVSFGVAMTQLGGASLMLRDEEVGVDKREPAQDVARVLSGMCDAIMARVFEHSKLDRLAQFSSIPIINGLSDYNHPCQAMADMLTLDEHFGKLAGLTLAYIGDANNVTRSLAVACGKFGVSLSIASPVGHSFSRQDLAEIRVQAPQLKLVVTHEPTEAVRRADAVYTDTWVSMGQEQEKAQRIRDFAGFSIDENLLAHAPRDAVVLHCLPAYRGMEISEAVIEGPRSLAFPQAENRLHVQKGLLAVLLAGK
jgi:ornithine carbamoyltransferase